ncbi:hypothetical protein [Halostella salina]|uniref:hypothetical protein n=1 Tax=Halostella salina TaxID=1547897 RepID=UPI000EF7B9CB|nr:hypothetical protein [Halostella salina]
MSAGNDDLHPILKRINETLANVRTEVQRVQGELEKVRTAITDGVETIRDAIQESIQAQAELKLMEHVMEAKAVKPQIEAEHDQIETEREELDERIATINERYERKHEELDRKANRRVRDVGSHIFDVQEDQFEEGIEGPFVDQVTTTWETLQSHNDEVKQDRGERVRGSVGDAVQTIHDFIDRQSKLIDDIDAHRFDDGRLPGRPGQFRQFQVPYYVVEYEEDGVAHSQLVVPSHVDAAPESEWSTVSLSPVSGATDLLGDVPTPRDGHSDPTPSTAIADHLSAYGEGSSLGSSYGDAVESALPDEQLSVTVEGGDR